jgi:hypothetical protein
MGGYLAALYAASHPEVERLVLLAPAFDFPDRWRAVTGAAKMEAWRESGWMDVLHYSEGARRPIHYGLFEDVLRYDSNPDFSQPARVFHGVHDETVPVEHSRRFCAAHPNALLTELDSDHELIDVLDEIVAVSVPFLTTTFS